MNDFTLCHRTQPYPNRYIVFPDYYPAAITVWSKQAFEKTGGFNEAYFCYWEDVELSLRTQQYDVKLITRSDLKAFHLGRGTTRKKQEYSQHFHYGKQLTWQLYHQKYSASSWQQL